MQGYTTNYVNLIADNLRDRYDNGFPILKELIQNADDAKARTFIFSLHPGIPLATHPLLTGPGLWFFNDGAFKASDARALRSFGINSKAGDTTAIGKFGLGMKSVFHLCEAFFYVAWDGCDYHNEGLTPWKREDHDPHPEWNESHDDDWRCLQDIGRQQVNDPERSWFLLWIPLRKRDHLRQEHGDETGAITNRFPGDDPTRELTFLEQESLALDLAELLPLLRHLECIEHRDATNSFVLELEVSERLLGQVGGHRTAGQVKANSDSHSLRFAGLRRSNHDPEDLFARIKKRDEWPRSWYRDDNGHEHLAEDKTTPEGAVLFCSGVASEQRSNLHWAVFLPVEQGGEKLRSQLGDQSHTLILHGQFFIDAGRKKIHDSEYLDQPPEPFGEGLVDDGLLRRTWNQRLAQQVLLPLVLPALRHYAESERLSPEVCASLTRSLADTGWFRSFRSYVCSDGVWLQLLDQGDEPAWALVYTADLDRLRPFPGPPKSDPGRPWRVFPRLSESNFLPFNRNAPTLSNRLPQWKEDDLDSILADVGGLFEDGPLMDYLTEFLESCAGSYLTTERLQRRLVDLLRDGLRNSGADVHRQLAKKSRGLIACVDPERRIALEADLPDKLLHRLWAVETSILLVPKGLEPEQAGRATPSDSTLASWLKVLDQSLEEGRPDADQEGPLTAVRGLLKNLGPADRGSFLRIHDGLRITAVRDARTERNRAVTYAEVREVRDAGALFGFGQGARIDRLGLAPQLAAVLPDSRVWLIRAETYRELFQDDVGLPRADVSQSCLRAIGRDGSGCLGDLKERRALLEVANEPGDDPDALRGLRYLLHGSSLHRNEDDATLWFPAHAQETAWAKLWGQLHEVDRWSLVSAELADTVPRSRWDRAEIREINANLIDELQRTGRDIQTPRDFSIEERDQILSQIDDEVLWKRLTLHTTYEGEPVSVAQERLYLVPESLDVDDWLLREATLIPISADPIVAYKQRKWLKSLGARARIEVALGTEKPSVHWRTIMDALAGLALDSEPELFRRLRAKLWLPNRDGSAVRPEDVIDLPGNLNDQAQRLVAKHRTVHGPRFAVPADLSNEFQAHEAWQGSMAGVCSSGTEALERLGSLLLGLPEYHVGRWETMPSSEIVNLLAECDLLPGWRLLRDASSDLFGLQETWHHLSSGLAKPMAPEDVRSVMEWLTANTEGWQIRKSALDAYLKQYLELSDFDRFGLSGVRLANRRSEWRDSSQLCVGIDGTDTGLDPSFLLESSQANILTEVLSRAGGSANVDESYNEKQREIDHRLFRSAHEKTPQTLASYFEPWGQFVPGPMIGAMIALLDPTSHDLASEYLQPYSYDWLLDQFDEAGGDSIVERMEHLKLAVHQIAGVSVTVSNLLGESIDVPLDDDARTLFGGPLSQKRTFRVQVPLRKIDPDGIEPERLSGLLRATAESLCAELYPPKRDLERLWGRLDNSNQLEVETARRVILNGIPHYLRQLSVRNDVIEDALLEHHRALTAIAQAGNDRDVPAECKLSVAHEALAESIANDRDAQCAVLTGVKGTIKQFQYELSSIPFELFQNADDAAVELGQIEAYPRDGCDIPDGARRLVVEVDGEYLRVLHWGRPINARGPVGFDGERRGYGRDLEKMLMLYTSDKRAEQGVTGKYGLGFKSVLLACELPRILSARMAIEVVAGILPRPLKDTEKARASLAQHRNGSRRLPGTMIELPGISAQSRDKILERFYRLAGVLCVFGRSIRSIALVGSEGKDFNLTWNPSEVCPGIEHGRLSLEGDWGAETDAVCIRVESGSLLVGLGPKGFQSLPDYVPSLWVTAPTQEQFVVGFALNGGFTLNTGRDELAGNSEDNRELARRIGGETGKALGNFFERSGQDWPTVRQRLNLAADLEAGEFWLGLWIGLTEGWIRRHLDAAVELAREAAMTLLSRLSDFPCAVPNGLPGMYGCFTDRTEIRYELKKPLAAPNVLGILGAWDRFTDKYPARACVSEDIGAILKYGKLSRHASLGLAALVGVLDPPHVRPQDALVLGKVLLLTEEHTDWKSRETKEMFKPLSFRTADDGWVEVGRLLANDGNLIDQEESLRHNLAPLDRRLHPDYYADDEDEAPAMSFFLECRGRLQAPVEELAKWVLSAEDDGERQAALGYLAQGDQRDAVSREVRGQGWLIAVPHDEILLAHFDPEQRRELKRLLASDEQIERGIGPDDPRLPIGGMRPYVDLATALNAVGDWWDAEGTSRAEEYRRRLYPAFSIDLREDSETGLCDRSSWLTLFALGAFQAMGRTKEVQHRGFIELCRRRGWWQTFAEIDPKRQPDKWMDIIEEYAEAQHDDEQWTQWIAQFPKLYRLCRWMDDYIDLFLSIDRFDEPFSLELILTPRANPHYQGTDFDTPPLNRTLRVGAHLVVRELLHHGVIRNPLADTHAYAPIERIQDLFERFGIRVERSKDIYEHLEKHLGPEQARFNGDYDIPLRILAVDADLQNKLFR